MCHPLHDYGLGCGFVKRAGENEQKEDEQKADDEADTDGLLCYVNGFDQGEIGRSLRERHSPSDTITALNAGTDFASSAMTVRLRRQEDKDNSSWFEIITTEHSFSRMQAQFN